LRAAEARSTRSQADLVGKRVRLRSWMRRRRRTLGTMWKATPRSSARESQSTSSPSL